MIHNILRSGYTFTPNEYALEIKVIMAITTLLFSTILLLVISVIFYFMGDMLNATIHFIGSLLCIVAFYLHRVMGKHNYSIVVYFMAALFFVLIINAYYLSPNIQPISGWIVIQILSSFLVLNITLAVWVTISFSSFMMLLYVFTEHTIDYILLQIAPAILGLFFVYVINKKFKMTIHLLEKSNNLLEIRVKERTKELESDKVKLDYQVHYDELTALPNRFFLKKELKKRIKNSREFSLLVIDLDRFKNINDIYGHANGDKVLKIVASRLNKLKSKEEFIARMSGDEFIYISASFQREAQETIASRIMNIIEKPIYVENKTMYISASVGIYLKKENHKVMDEMFAYSDIAMFEAKKKGRGGFEFFTPNMMKNMKKKVKLESDMKEALRDKNFILYFQPQVDISNKNISAIETLVRWEHPIKGLINPSDFISLAEEIDIIVELDYYVLEEGMNQIVSWLYAGYIVPRVSFNISGQHLKEDFFEYIKYLLHKTKCAAHYIELEITEGYFISDISIAIEMLTKLRKLGISIAIDDFGKGYSSLSYLKDLPVNKIKIDKSFINNVYNDKVDATIVSSVINIASSLDIAIVAEGVECREQIEYLSDIGCKYIQGYYFYKPMTAGRIEELLVKVD